MKERPIIFSGPMVHAILENRKFQTRRVMNFRPFDVELFEIVNNGTVKYRRPAGDPMLDEARSTPGYSVRSVIEGLIERCPYGKPGDRLWVRETFLYRNNKSGAVYREAYTRQYGVPEAAGVAAMYGGWKPSIHMPRKFSRITLEIEQVRVQRVQEISGADCEAEGLNADTDSQKIEAPYDQGYAMWAAILRGKFKNLWDSINSKRGYGWEVNPWVWCLTFKRVSA